MNFIILTAANGPFYQRALGAYQIAHHLRQNGYTCQVIDFTYSFTTDELISTVEKFITKETLGVGVSTSFYDHDESENPHSILGLSRPGLHRNICELFEHLHNNYPHIKRIAGGAYGDNYANDPLFDYGIAGYAEDEMISIANELSGKNTDHICQFDIATLDHRFTDQDCILPGETLPIEISRGCIFRCKFCSFPLNGKKKLDYIRSAKLVADEMRYNYEKFGVTNYIFTDDTFNDSTEKLKLLYEEISKLPFKIKFYAFLRIDLLYAHQEQIQLLKDLGLRSASFGVETFHPVAAKAIGKGMPGDKVKEFLLDLHYKHWGDDVHIFCSMIVGLPGESIEHCMDGIKWFHNSPISSGYQALTFYSNYKWKSEFIIDPERYGYKFDENGNWYNDHMTQAQANRVRLKSLVGMKKHRVKIDAYSVLNALSVFTDEQVKNLTWHEYTNDIDNLTRIKLERCEKYKEKLKQLYSIDKT